MAKVQSYTKYGVDAKFNSRSNMTMVHNGGGSPDVASYPDAKTGDVIERSSDGARWGVVASTASPIAGRVVSVAGKSGVVSLGPGDVGAAPVSHTHTKAQISDLPIVSTSATNNSIVQRTSTGQVQVPNTPIGNQDATSRRYVDDKFEATPLNTENLNDVVIPGDYIQHAWHEATDDRNYPVNSSGGNLTVSRGGSYIQQEFTINTSKSKYFRTRYRDVWYPWNAIVDKAYVDLEIKDQIDTKFESDYLTTQNLNDLVTPGNYFQGSNANVTTDRNYPPGARAGHLVVIQGSVYVKQEYTDYQANAIYYRTMYSSTWYPWKSISQSEA